MTNLGFVSEATVLLAPALLKLLLAAGIGFLTWPTRVQAASCNSFVGKWAWFAGGEVTAYANGTFTQQSGNSGTWQCTDPAKGVVTMRWQRGGFVNRMTISEDGVNLASVDPGQAYVTARRVGTAAGPAPAPTSGPTPDPTPLRAPDRQPGTQVQPTPTVPLTSGSFEQAESLFQQGRKLAGANQCAQAIPYYDRAIHAYPRHSRSYSDRGRCRALLGQLSPGLQDLDRAVEAAPNDKSPYFNRADLRADAGDGAGALADLDRSIRLDTLNAATRAARAALFEISGQANLARMDSDSAYQLVDTFMSRRRAIVDQVLRQWRAKRARIPLFAPARGNPIQAAAAAINAGRDREALATLDAALAIQPGDISLLAFRGRLHREIGQAALAVQDLNPAIQQGPSAALLIERGRALRQLCRFREEVADYEHAMRLSPNLAMAYFERAYTTMFFDKRLDAIPDLTKVIQLEPGNWAAYNFRGQLNYYWFHLVDAMADFRKAVALNPNFGQAYCNMAFALRGNRQMNEANAWLEKCFALDPTEREVARREFAQIRLKEEQGARDLEAFNEWMRTRPRGGDTKYLCNSGGGTWTGPERPSDGGFCMLP
jgi:tetratricopeptide (TPR) repeat protein